jgi:Holliday junction resolvasome RuvABC DNA-binding subunit
VNLGYQRQAAERALATVAKNGKDGSFETMFRNALAAMAK